MLPAEDEQGAADDHRSNADVRLPVQAVLLVFCYFDYTQIHNLFLGNEGEACIHGQDQTYNEKDDACCFHDGDPSMEVLFKSVNVLHAGLRHLRSCLFNCRLKVP